MRSLSLSSMLTLGLLACAPPPGASTQPRQPVRLVLNSLAGGQQAGFMQAQALGYFADEGIELSIDESHSSTDAVEAVASERSQFGYADALSVAQLRATGARVTVVSTILQSDRASLLSLQAAPLRQLGDLHGKTVAAATGRSTALLRWLLSANQLNDVQLLELNAADLDDALSAGRVAAILGTVDFDVPRLQRQGLQLVQLPTQALGDHLPGLSLVTSDELIQRDPHLVSAMVRASVRGWDAARQDPPRAARAVVDQFLAGYEDEVATALEADLPLLCSDGNQVIGAPSPAAWSATPQLASALGLLPASSASASPAPFWTPQFLPPDAAPCP